MSNRYQQLEDFYDSDEKRELLEVTMEFEIKTREDLIHTFKIYMEEAGKKWNLPDVNEAQFHARMSIEKLEQIDEVDDNNRYLFLMALGDVHIRNFRSAKNIYGDMHAAIDAYTRAIKELEKLNKLKDLVPLLESTYFKLGCLYARLGCLHIFFPTIDKSLESIGKSLEIGRKNYNFINYIILALLLIRKCESGVDENRKFIVKSVDPKDTEDAIEYLEKAIDYSEQIDSMKVFRENLKNLKKLISKGISKKSKWKLSKNIQEIQEKLTVYALGRDISLIFYLNLIENLAFSLEVYIDEK
ncbi:MAG: hypothetical protein GPJ51_07115 [Candidatus Heimdallarchaeota archaeon]|nr:hypothetical protein [Candidatus Heimdallarchaeota archaeon]